MAKEDTAALDEWPTADPSAIDGGEVARANEHRFRQEFGPAPFGLFVTSLGIESNPYHISSVGGVSHLPHLFSNRCAEINFRVNN